MPLRRVRTVGPGDALSSREWNKLVGNVDTLTARAELPTPGSVRLHTTRTSDGTIAAGDRMAWPDEPVETVGVEVTSDGEGARLTQAGVYFVVAQIGTLGDMNRGSQVSVAVAEHGNRHSLFGSNSYRLPNSHPMVQTTATVVVTDPVDIAVWWVTDSTETMPIYTSVNRTMLSVLLLAPWEVDTDADR